MSTRLDRLIGLLESGSNEAIRSAAAKQIGELARIHPDEAYSLIDRVGALLFDKTWETRVASGVALSCIAQNIEQYKPLAPVKKEDELKGEHDPQNFYFQNPQILYSLATFDLDETISTGKVLLSSADSEVEDIEISDAQYSTISTESVKFNGKTMTHEGYSEQSIISARQRNLMKRKAKCKNYPKKSKQSEKGTKTDSTVPEAKKLKTSDSKIQSTFTVGWVFQQLCEKLKQNLFDASWEIRHGAALGLKEILKHHAASAGLTPEHYTTQSKHSANCHYLEDCIVRLLHIFALDRFGDYVSDQVVAPVREMCAQTLGVILANISGDFAKGTIKCLIKLATHPQWEIKLGGLLGLKYAVAICHDTAKELMGDLLSAIIPSLEDLIDDIKAVSADTLIPIAEDIIQFSSSSLQSIQRILWDILLELDDLSAATSSVMQLLAKFYTLASDKPETTKFFFKTELGQLVPRLWQFLRHNNTAVRMSCIKTLKSLVSGSNSHEWIIKISDQFLRYLFQNILLETRSDIVELSLNVWEVVAKILASQFHLWKIIADNLSSWITLLATPLGTNFDTSLLLLPDAMKPLLQYSEDRKAFAIRTLIEDPEEQIQVKLNGCKAICVSARICIQLTQNDGNEKKPQNCEELFSLINTLLNSSWASHRQLAGLIIRQLVIEISNCNDIRLQLDHIFPPYITQTIQNLTTNHNVLYSEIQKYYSEYINDMNTLLQTYMAVGIDITRFIENQTVSLENAAILTSQIYDQCLREIGNNNQRVQDLELKKNNVLRSINSYQNSVAVTHISTVASLCSAMVQMKLIPANPENIVSILVSSVQKEHYSSTLQKIFAESLSDMISICAVQHPQYNVIVIQTICKLLCDNMKPISSEKKEDNQQTSSEVSTSYDEKANIHRGMVHVLSFVAKKLNSSIFKDLPVLWQVSGDILNNIVDSNKILDRTSIVNALHIIDVLLPSLHESLHDTLELLLSERLISLTTTDEKDINNFASQTIASMCCIITHRSMKIIYAKLIPILEDPRNEKARRGAISTLYKIISKMELNILPYIVLFVVPLLRRMSDQDMETREIASKCFGNVIKILPLEKSVSSPPDFDAIREKERRFLEQLLDNRKVEQFEIPIKINAELRQYQKDGVSWLAFLNKFNLHGILCDDMGLGKTLQTICMVASDIELRKIKHEETKSEEFAHLPSLIVCPPTLVGHWYYEIKKFCPQITAMNYSGNPQTRKQMREQIPEYDIVIMSYDILRNDIENIDGMSKGGNSFNYCVLDEGHIIKNAKTKITRAVKMIKANHRLILSGTPIQNNVLELWSLFDFLMPGFLGNEKEFNQQYSKPILASREAKANSKEQEAATLALEALHRQVLPFLLRRVKEDVLKDLPEKIIQDYYCELTALQQRLYEDFSKKHFGEDDMPSLETSTTTTTTTNKSEENRSNSKWHVFQALQYLRKLCNHPLLVLNENHPEYKEVMKDLENQNKDIHDISFSPKLMALKQLLHECGLGMPKKESFLGSSTSSVTMDSIEAELGHRVLIFAQLKSMLDIIEHDLFKKHMPSLTYMRLDGSVESFKRHSIVTKFNSDPTIDVLLLTTHVGGLGLNLTGADTVIFVEHDWNPSADLQAMDRAHRIGQKRVVNVYRLITKNTLEEKIMGLQKFKMNISKTVVNQENSSLKSMDTERLVDLFALGSSNSEDEKKSESESKGQGKLASVLQEAGELWDAEKQYEDFNIDSFLKSMKK